MSGWFPVGEAANEAILALVLKVTLLFGGGLAVTALLRRGSAAVRHAALVATLAAAVALPALGAFLPAWDLPILDRSRGAALETAAPASSHSSTRPSPHALEPAAAGADLAPAGGRRPIEARPDLERGRTEGATLPWLGWLYAAWAAGALVVLLRFAGDAARMQVLARQAIEAPTDVQDRLASRVARRLGIRRPVRILYSERLSVPVTWGVWRPAVVLPLEARDWDAAKCRIVLLHELAHVRRLDCLTFGLAEIASALWWFHPLLWSCRKRLRVEQERACDDVVLLEGVRATAYAELLVEVARRLAPPEEPPAPRAAIAMARPSTLRTRVEKILTAGSRRVRLGRKSAGAVVLAAACLVLPLAAVHLWGETTAAREVADLVQRLHSADPFEREAAAWRLGVHRSDEAVEPLIERLADEDPRVRGVAARALGKIGDRRAFGPLARLLRDSDPHVRELAVLGLVDLDDDRAVAALTPMLSDPVMGVRSVAVWALSLYDDPRALGALARAALSDPDLHTRDMAIQAIGKGARGNRAGVPTLIRLLEDPDPGIRSDAAGALADVGDARAVPALVSRLEREADAGIRERIADALGRFADRPKAVEGLLDALADPEWPVRHSAVVGLAESDDPRAARGLLRALRDPVHQVRLEAAWSLDAIEARREPR